MNQVFPLLVAAGWGELVGSIVGMLFLVLWVIGQIADAKKAAQQPRQQQPGGPPQPGVPPQQAGQAGAKPAPQPDELLRDQVEEFLRRAAARQQQPDQPRPGQAKAAPDVVDVRLVEMQPAARPRESLSEQRRSREALAAKPKPEPVAPQRPTRAAAKKRSAKTAAGRSRESVAQHVAEHVSAATRSLGDQSARLGQTVVRADKQFDAQLEARFGNNVGSLAELRAERAYDQQTGPAPETPAGQIAALLSSPTGIRQAILINEILRRPEERW